MIEVENDLIDSIIQLAPASGGRESLLTLADADGHTRHWIYNDGENQYESIDSVRIVKQLGDVSNVESFLALVREETLRRGTSVADDDHLKDPALTTPLVIKRNDGSFMTVVFTGGGARFSPDDRVRLDSFTYGRALSPQWNALAHKGDRRQLRILSLTRSTMRAGEISVDLFAGGGGWSEGFQWATGVPPAVAVNHDEHAIAMHTANHPESRHFREDVWRVDPRKATCGCPVGWLHLSVDCTHFSRAKGGKPVKKKIRGLAWVGLKWAAQVSPRIISLENVAEFVTWGPLIAKRCKKSGRVIKVIEVDGKRLEVVAEPGERVPVQQQLLVPDPKRKGEYFRQWCRELNSLGYRIEWRNLKACDYGAPTSRKRLFVLARRDGQLIRWPKATHAPRNSEAVKSGELLSYRTAAECIDWSIPARSIFDRKKPLAEATLRRIAEGLRRFLFEAADPFLVNLTHGGLLESLAKPMKTITAANRGEKAIVAPIVAKSHSNGWDRDSSGCTPGDEPVGTIIPKDGLCVVAPSLVRTAHGDIGLNGSTRWGNGAHSSEEPLPTVTGSNDFALVAPTLIQTGYGEREGQRPRSLDLHEPLGTAVAEGQKHALCAAVLKHYGGVVGSEIAEPLDTVTSKDHNALLTASVTKLYGTSTGSAADEPLPTVTGQGGHLSVTTAEIVEAPVICKYYGNDSHGQPLDIPLATVTTKDRCALVKAFLQRFLPGMKFVGDYVTVAIRGIVYVIVDIAMRMLVPRELARATGFPDDYILIGTNTQQVARIGNAVPPAFPAAIVAANLNDGDIESEVAA